MTSPNNQQQELIEHTDGLYLVDAGAGTGKTFTITRRYANIVGQDGVEPDDVLLLTFTNNAAGEMRDRIVSHCEYGMRTLRDAPIQTFHSLCHDILEKHGVDAPTHLGIEDRITDSTRLITDELVEEALFKEYYDQFVDTHPEYTDYFRIISNPSELLGVIRQLTAKGVFPDEDGWYRNGEQSLDGDFEAFKSIFDSYNEPRNDGRKQSKLRQKLRQFGKNKCYLPNAPPKSEIRGSRTKQIPTEVAQRVFDTDRSGLKSFIHDLYYEYLEFALQRNYLNFGFLQLFAFVLLCEDHRLRDEIAFEYVMIDEFQDSSEIQFKLALLLSSTKNFCVVGDWKQSIYSFQYAAVENIIEFKTRLESFIDELNDEYERVSFDPSPIQTIELEENYRSTQEILEFSENGLLVSATSRDDVDTVTVRDQIVPLSSNSTYEQSRIEAFHAEDEHEAILAQIQEIVNNDQYAVEDDGSLRPPTYEDIAVLTRTRDFGRELQRATNEYRLPVAYEGGIELFHTNQAKLLLAWLRILEGDTDRGWAAVLEQAGYLLDEIAHILETESYPTEMGSFKKSLDSLETVGAIARRIFSKYGYTGEIADVLLQTIQSVHNETMLTRGDLIRFIERGIENGSIHEVNVNADTDSVTVQTIHAAKGLEYPIVIIANMNSGRFPPRGGNSSPISYQDPVGLRQRKQFAEIDRLAHIYDDWQTDVLNHCLPREYDEERRLLYVAITRAESHVLFSAGENPNTFLEELPVEVESVEAEPTEVGMDEREEAPLEVSVPDSADPDRQSPHSIMRDDVFDEITEGMGTAFGDMIHDFAEAYAKGEEVSVPVNEETPDKANVVSLIDSLNGELITEENAYLPIDVNGSQVTISGIIDLVHVLPDRIEIIDYKTDRGRHAESEYRKQLSVYYHVLESVYPDREITAAIYYTATGEIAEIDPLTKGELRSTLQNTTTQIA
ncbi:ATP-dependent DNA helicase [Haloprofundus marisrubri]|uniref:DNA 3'-5' helicase n=1 Tax=Haloprofundus marisrubri TaxID=1514971 RepID=A0A0W1RD96_9EURY|nr:ATP-dependent DNA helicase [Haloprofundus marisrubri]KTG11405.1 ATP-dependent DNA helicase [Haloprofundus marisrubri]